MSKWLLEPEEWPKVTKQPLVTRVHGVKGNEDARRIVQQFEAPLAHFLVGQTQLRVGSGLDVYASHQELDGIKASYTYQNGMEYLDIYVPESGGGVTEETDIPWDWALVNLKVPHEKSAQFSAFEIVPHYKTTGEGTTYDLGDNGHGDKPISFPDTANIAFQQLGDITVDGDFTAASLLFDLRVVGPKSAVSVDLYGRLVSDAGMCGLQTQYFPVTITIAMPTPGPTPMFGDDALLDSYRWYLSGYFNCRLAYDCNKIRIPLNVGSGSFTIDSEFSSLPARFHEVSFIGDIITGVAANMTIDAVHSGSELTITIDADDRTAVTPWGDWTDGIWITSRSSTVDPRRAGWLSLNISGQHQTGAWDDSSAFVSSASITYSGGPSGPSAATNNYGFYATGTFDSMGNGQENYDFYFAPYPERGAPDSPADVKVQVAPVIISGVTGRGDPNWKFSEHHSDNTSYRVWEGPQYPSPIPTGVISQGQVHIDNQDKDVGTLDNFYGMTFLGTITADRKTGSITFKAA